MVVFGLFVRLYSYPMQMQLLMHVCMLRECDGARVTAMLVERGSVWVVQVLCLVHATG